MSALSRFATNANNLLNFLGDFFNPTPKDVNWEWKNPDDTITNSVIPNAKKFQQTSD